ncbi:hypothetical protein KSP40_PGU018611 [Platanthera guangdongensis]|uniref:Uncharacterized protein n=1 Tax=Platanthera guangdongensis TaxID=2320717 RepID=A0ABR2M483_9ASPA
MRYLSANIREVCEEDKCESDCVRSSVEVGTHNILPYPIVTGSGFTNYDFDPFTYVKKVDEMLHDESRSITTVDSCNNYSGECQTAYDLMGGRIWKNKQLLSPQVEKHQCLTIDVVGNVNATGSPAKQLDQNSCGMIIGGDDKKTIQVLFDESSTKCMTAEGCQFNASQLTSLLFNSHKTFNELLPYKSVYITQYDDTCVNVKVDDSNSYSLSGENLSFCNAASAQTNSPKLINSISEEIMVDTKAIPSLLISNGECRIHGNVHVDNLEKNSLELHFYYEEHSRDSPIDINHATGLEKVDLLGYDDSQYEDGELPESVLNSYGEDEVEEVEIEYVDYGSDYREAESFEAESEFNSQSDLAVGTIEYKPEGRILSTCDVNRFWATEGSQSKCFQKHSTIKDYSKAIYGEGEVGGDILRDSGKVLDVNMASEAHTREEKRFISSNLPTDVGVVSGNAIQPSSSRMKSSGWEKLPKHKEFSGYASVSIIYSLPSHASKWCNSERIFQDRLWYHDEPKHPRERSPAISSSQRNRLKDMDSRIRMKPDEYYEPNYSERFQEEYCGYGRGSKPDGIRDDQRGKNNMYEVLHHEGHLESNDNMSCLHYDSGISAHNQRQKSLGLQPRQSLRSFDRSIDSQNVDSP